MGWSGSTAFWMRLMVAKVQEATSTTGYQTSLLTNFFMRDCCSADGPTAEAPPPSSMPVENLCKKKSGLNGRGVGTLVCCVACLTAVS